MSIAEIMREVRKLPDDELLRLAAEVEEAAARVVDLRFEQRVRDGDFDALAARALEEHRQGQTVPLDEVLDHQGLS